MEKYPGMINLKDFVTPEQPMIQDDSEEGVIYTVLKDHILDPKHSPLHSPTEEVQSGTERDEERPLGRSI